MRSHISNENSSVEQSDEERRKDQAPDLWSTGFATREKMIETIK